jgi:hypothetical protein
MEVKTDTDSDAEFKRMIAYFWLERGDPTRYTRWDAERCRKLLPDFYLAWTNAESFRRLATLAIKGAE